jgi:hypothetical protein
MVMQFKSFVELKEDKNTHMEHIEDLIFNEGVAGMRRAINFLQDLRDMLAGSNNNKVTATVKWDGAPAIFCGIDPTDGKFFVAKKGVFNKSPKIYKKASEVDADTSGDLADKLKIALSEFSKLGIKSGVYQGDLMFTSDTKEETIDGQRYITFHPNTILYAVPYDSELGKKIRSSKIGVVWHTTYTGTSFETMKASFGKTITDKFNTVNTIWMDDANYKDYSGTATFTQAETKRLTAVLAKAGKLFRKINGRTIDYISNDPDLLTLVKTYNNTKVRAGEKITNTTSHVAGLIEYIRDKYQKEIDSKKTDKSKQQWIAKRDAVMQFFKLHSRSEIVNIFDLSNLVADAKQMIINKMNEAGHIKTFLKTTTGFKTTGVEGFVAIDHMTGGAVKIVDRMEFSKANFSADILKGWSS